jgi:hypothetical protein
VTSLCRRRCRPISSALWWRARSRFTPWTQALECTTRTWPLPRERHPPRGWPRAGRIGARPRNCGSWWAATRLQRPATRLDVSCRVAAPRRGHVVVGLFTFQTDKNIGSAVERDSRRGADEKWECT